MYYPWLGGQSADWDANGTNSTFFEMYRNLGLGKEEDIQKHRIAGGGLVSPEREEKAATSSGLVCRCPLMQRNQLNLKGIWFGFVLVGDNAHSSIQRK